MEKPSACEKVLPTGATAVRRKSAGFGRPLAPAGSSERSHHPLPLKTRPSGSPEQFVERWMARGRVPGAALAVIGRGRKTSAQGYGFRDLTERLPATPRTIFGLASVTKSFTALAVLRLEEEGLLHVRDPVVRHLPEFRTPNPRATRRITLHHFLTHTSGLPPLPTIVYLSARSLSDDPSYDPEEDRRCGIDPDHPPIDTYEQLLEYLASTRYRLLGPPGRLFSYSNEAYALLGAVIERVSGRAYESYVEEVVLRPLGMRSTTFDDGIMFRRPEVTTLYAPQWSGRRRHLRPVRNWGQAPCLRACGGLRSTAMDMERLVRMFLNSGRVDGERIVSTATLRRMTSPQVQVFPGIHYGYGIVLQPDFHGTPVAYHSGSSLGVSSLFVAAPRRGIGGVLLTNVQGSRPELGLMAMVNARLGLPLTAPIEPTPTPTSAESSLRQYEGWYGSGEGVWFEVRARRDRLWLYPPRRSARTPPLELRPAGRDRFSVTSNRQSDQVRFERNRRQGVWAAFRYWRLIRRRGARVYPRARTRTPVW